MSGDFVYGKGDSDSSAGCSDEGRPDARSPVSAAADSVRTPLPAALTPFPVKAASETLLHAVLKACSPVMVGQQALMEQLLVSILCRGHSRIIGPAGVGRWLAVQTLGNCLGLDARKLRCFPELQSEELVGKSDGGDDTAGSDNLPSGPLFGNLVLVDNIDRLSPRIYSLIQQAMQEQVIRVRDECWVLPKPFSVFATRFLDEEHEERAVDSNDDRFLLEIAVPYPPYHEEYAMAQVVTQVPHREVHVVLSVTELLSLQQRVLSQETPPAVVHYAVRLVRATRVHEGENPDFVYEWVQRGAGPRAVHGLVLAAKAHALMHGRAVPAHGDVRAVALPILRHRIATNRNARANGITPDRVIARLLDEIPRRVAGDEAAPRSGESFTFHDWTPLDDA